jgi:hypothetical protein
LRVRYCAKASATHVEDRVRDALRADRTRRDDMATLFRCSRYATLKTHDGWGANARLVTQKSYGSSDSGGAEPLSSGSSGPAPASRTSVASISVMTATPGIGSSITSTTTVSTTGVLGGDFTALALFRAFVAPRLRLALPGLFLRVAFTAVRFAILFRARLEGLRALRRAIDVRFRTAGRFFR